MIESCGGRLKILELNNSTLSPILLVKILLATPNVKLLRFINVQLQRDPFGKVDLPQLQDVIAKLSRSDPRICGALQQSSIVKADLELVETLPILVTWAFQNLRYF